jgi:hypothetical protein
MGLKGYRLWGMGQLDLTRRAPPQHAQTLAKPQQIIRIWNLVNHDVDEVKLEMPAHHPADGDEDETVV